MKMLRWPGAWVATGILGMLCTLGAGGAEPLAPEALDTTAADRKEGESRVSVAVARDRAVLLHNVYAATLEVMHERYFHGERAIVPARALEDIFAELSRQSKVEARWISVNTKPMSIQHEPKSDFEKRAAAAIAAGKGELELVEGGYYQRAEAIPLAEGCVSCHSGHFTQPAKSPRFAGLVIRIPVQDE